MFGVLEEGFCLGVWIAGSESCFIHWIESINLRFFSRDVGTWVGTADSAAL